jgi:hypothetical protein
MTRAGQNREESVDDPGSSTSKHAAAGSHRKLAALMRATAGGSSRTTVMSHVRLVIDHCLWHLVDVGLSDLALFCPIGMRASGPLHFNDLGPFRAPVRLLGMG